MIYAKKPVTGYAWMFGEILREYNFLNEDYEMTEETRQIVAGPSEMQIEDLPPRKRIRAKINRNMMAFKRSMPANINADRVIEIATSVVTQNPQLLQCTDVTLLGGILKIAQLGLDATPAAGQCALVPMKRRTRGGEVKECAFWLQYRGMIALATRHNPDITKVIARAVFKGEQFSHIEGTKPDIVHVPSDQNRSIENLLCTYAIAFFRDGSTQFHVCYQDELEEARAASPSVKLNKTDTPWFVYPRQQCLKTAVRRLFNYLSIDFSSAGAVMHGEPVREAITDDGVIEGSVHEEDPDEAWHREQEETPAIPGHALRSAAPDRLPPEDLEEKPWHSESEKASKGKLRAQDAARKRLEEIAQELGKISKAKAKTQEGKARLRKLHDEIASFDEKDFHTTKAQLFSVIEPLIVDAHE